MVPSEQLDPTFQSEETVERRDSPKFRAEITADSLVCRHHDLRNGDGTSGDRRRTSQRDVLRVTMTLNTEQPSADARLIVGMREREERAAPSLEKAGITLLVDGVGATGHGEDTIATAVSLGIAAEELAKLDPEADAEASRQAMVAAAKEANAVLNDFASPRPDLKGKTGAAFAAARVVGGPDGRPQVPYAHGGNVRLLHFRAAEDCLVEVSVDDTAIGDALRAGSLTEEQYRLIHDARDLDDLPEELRLYHATDSELTDSKRVLGFTPKSQFEPHSGILQAEPGDLVILATDGVHSRLILSDLEKLARHGAAADQICRVAKATLGEDDDTSAVVIRLPKAA